MRRKEIGGWRHVANFVPKRRGTNGGGPAIATPCEGEEGGPGGEDPSGRGPTPATARTR
jgi:hypothetical protein